MATAVGLTLASAPFEQFYLAWVGLVPWFIAVAESRTAGGAAVRGWFGGLLYFSLNLWWLWTASLPGAVVVIVCSAAFWAAAAVLIHWFQWLKPIEVAGIHGRAPSNQWAVGASRAVALSALWVTFEWLRCRVAGFAWLPLGSTQSPLPVLCQTADLGGPWIISFWVALVNAAIAHAWTHRRSLRCITGAASVAAATVMLTVAYGAFRIATTELATGPRVMILQTNFPTLPGGGLTASPEEVARFCLDELRTRLPAQPVDLVVLPEATFPPLNDESRRELAPSPVGPFLQETHEALESLAKAHNVSLVVGGNAVTGWKREAGARVGTEIRNSAYYYDPLSTAGHERYDKLRLVAFSERVPFADGPAWLHRLALAIAASRASQPMQPGDPKLLRPFTLKWTPSDGGNVTTRFLTPICLENVDPQVIRRMVGDPESGEKRCEFLVNLSSDGWFADQEKMQHLQLVTLRTIENRLPMVRCSNTGSSAFIDSLGRIHDALPVGVANAAVRTIQLDHRQTFYTRYGDVFAGACIAGTMFAAVHQAFRRADRKQKR